jgi:hypothetical protein
MRSKSTVSAAILSFMARAAEDRLRRLAVPVNTLSLALVVDVSL